MVRKISRVRKSSEAEKTYRCPCCHFKTLFGRDCAPQAILQSS
jgi:transcription initiation factor IIE alpha subunit